MTIDEAGGSKETALWCGGWPRESCHSRDMFVYLTYLRFLLIFYLPPWTINISALAAEYAKAAGILAKKEGAVAEKFEASTFL